MYTLKRISYLGHMFSYRICSKKEKRQGAVDESIYIKECSQRILNF